jgi:futalosine hydrolase
MQILVLAATSFEISAFREAHPDAHILIGGVGVPGTIYSLTHRLLQFDYDLVIQAGIAGSFEPAHEGKVFTVRKDRFADLGIHGKSGFHSVFDMGFEEKDSHPYEDGWLVNNSIGFPGGIAEAAAITVNSIHQEPMVNQRYREKYMPLLETMEGAGLHYVCLLEKIPFLQLRAVSNEVGERDKEKWKMKESIAALNIELTRIYNHYLQHGA